MFYYNIRFLNRQWRSTQNLYWFFFFYKAFEIRIILFFQRIEVFHHLCLIQIWPFSGKTFLNANFGRGFKKFVNYLLGARSLYCLFSYLIFKAFLWIFHIWILFTVFFEPGFIFAVIFYCFRYFWIFVIRSQIL